MSGVSSSNSSLRLGRWRGVQLRLHILYPIGALLTLLASQFGLCSLRQAGCGLLVLAVSNLLHTGVRWIVAHRLGGETRLIVLSPIGGWSQPRLPVDPPPLLLTSISGLATYLAICVAAACALALTGEADTLRLLSPFNPTLRADGAWLRLAAEQSVWINGLLFVLNLLPVRPFDGAELMRGVLWPLFGEEASRSITAMVAIAGSVISAILAFWLRPITIGGSFPAWFPLAFLAVVLLYGGNRAWLPRPIYPRARIDELDSDDDQWLSADWIDEDRTPVLVEQLQEKQQESFERKRQEREDLEDARVDDILSRLQVVSFHELTEEEQAILKRASRRYRRRLGDRRSK